MFLGKKYGSLVWGLRFDDLPNHMVAKREAWEVAGCVDGPTEPKDYKYIFQYLVDYFAAVGVRSPPTPV